MKALVFAFWICAIFPSLTVQQKAPPPDLSGTWALVPSQSSFGDKQKDTTDYQVTIIQQEPEIKITAKYKLNGVNQVEEWSYYTDGRPQPTPGVKDLEIATHWRGRKLYTSFHLSRPVDTLTEDEWQLSIDGRTLTRTTRQTFVGRFPYVKDPSQHKYVFVRRK